MESMFQNCVSEFDLNFLEQTGNVNQAPPVTFCPAAQKLSLGRIKGKMKGFSQVLLKAKKTTESLVELQKKYAESKLEIEETRNLLFKKNEEYKVVCDERTTYFNQLTENAIDCQNMKDLQKINAELVYENKLKDKIISGYSEQMKGIRTEMDDLIERMKQKEREASLLKAREVKLEKKLMRVLKQYVVPQIKTRDRWLKSNIKRYVPDVPKGGIEESSQDQGDVSNIEDDDEELSTPPALNLSTNVDFDCAGSVDTGRGSSLTCSDGEKSFHSPEYSMDGSPSCTVNIICNKCNLPKSDDSNILKSPGRSGNDDNSATNVCKCLAVSQKDITTSPTRKQITDTATEPSDISTDINIPGNDTTNLEENNANNQIYVTKSNVIRMILTPVKEENESGHTEISSNHPDGSRERSLTSPRTLQELTFDSDDGDHLGSSGSRDDSPADKVITSSHHFSDEVITEGQICKKDPVKDAADLQDNIGLDADGSDEDLENVSQNQNHDKQLSASTSDNESPASIIPSNKEVSSISEKLQNDTASDSDDDEVMNNVTPIKMSHIFSPVGFDNSATTCTDIDRNKSPMTPNNLEHTTTGSKINKNRSKENELECLNDNNSKNYNRDVETDSEIQTIFDKMRLRLPIITPIPTTPPRRKMPSPELPTANQTSLVNLDYQKLNQMMKENLKEMAKTEITPFMETMTKNSDIFAAKYDILAAKYDMLVAMYQELLIPRNLEQRPHLPSHGNEQFLRDLLPDPSKSYENHPIHENTHIVPSFAHIASTNKRQPDVVDLNTDSMFCIIGTNENEDSNCNDHTIIEEEADSEHRTTNIKNIDTADVVANGTMCSIYKNAVQNNDIPNSSLLKAERPYVSGLNIKLAANNDKKRKEHPIDDDVVCDNTRDFECDENMHDVEHDYSTPACAIESDTVIPSVQTYKNNIVYEGKEMSDDDSEIQISDLDNSTVNHDEINAALINRRKKMRKLTRLETMRLKLLPKNKIKNDVTKSVRKLRPKPIPINTVPKKIVKASDTAASLNEKSVYENAVKVLAALRLAKEPRIIIKDCVLSNQYNSQRAAKDQKDIVNPESSSKSMIKNKIKNSTRLSESPRQVPENQILGSKESLSFDKAKDKSLDINTSKKSSKELNDVSPNRSRTRNNSDVGTPSTKRGHVIEHTLERKRKRISESGRQISTRLSKSNDSTESSSLRVLRSSDVKHNKEAEITETPNVGQKRERLRSKADKNNLEDNSLNISSERKPEMARMNTRRSFDDNSSIISSGIKPEMARMNTRRSFEDNSSKIISSGRKPEMARVNTRRSFEDNSSIVSSGRKPEKARVNTRRSFGEIESEEHSSIITETPIKISDNAISTGNINLSKTEDKLQLSYNNTTARKSRVARQNTSRSPEAAQVVQRSSTMQETSEKNKASSLYAGPSLNTNSHDQPDQNKLHRYDNTSNIESGRTSSLPRQKTSSETMQVDAEKSKYANPISYEDLSLFDDDNQSQGEDLNNLDSDDKPLILYVRNKPTIASETLNSETTKVGVHTTPNSNNTSAVSYEDLNLFSGEEEKAPDGYRKDSLLCRMIERYGVHKLKFVAKQVPDSKVTEICKRLENSLTEIIEAPQEECRTAMKRLVAQIRTWNVKHFIVGFIKFLKAPERKLELFNKSICPPFPPMTKKEQVLLYVFDELQKSYDYRNVVQKILVNIEYTLLALNKPAEAFDVIETMSHFYALLCRAYQKISQLRLFVVDAMYCLQMKSVVLIQQCLEVWMFVLPLGHMGLAKCPLVTCLVYLLHFYKCEDKFNRVQEIRNTLRYKYNYDVADWNENKILEMFRTAIIEIRDSSMERKTLRLSLLILAKRQGAKWCHNSIVKNMLQPIISDNATSARAKHFCVSLLGPLLKPYPANMKVHYEMVIDYLMDMLHRKNSQKMQEAIISSLIYVDKNNNRLYQFLAKWAPKQVSPEFELIFKSYVRSRPVHGWKQILSWSIY